VTTYYLAGPMSGIPQFNFPAFFAAAAELRARGYDIVSPAELDDEEDKGAALKSVDGAPGTGTSGGQKTWADFLARDVKLIADKVQGIIYLQPNWYKSRGARLESFVGLLQSPSFEFLEYNGPDMPVTAIDREDVLSIIYTEMMG
jgi:hypothetical protein